MIKYVKHKDDTIENFDQNKLENSIKDVIIELGNMYSSIIYIIVARMAIARLHSESEIVTTKDIIREVNSLLNNCNMHSEADLYAEKYTESIPV